MFGGKKYFAFWLAICLKSCFSPQPSSFSNIFNLECLNMTPIVDSRLEVFKTWYYKMQSYCNASSYHLLFHWSLKWEFLTCRFKLEMVANTFWQIVHVVRPLWIPRWFLKESLLENVLKQISQGTVFFSLRPCFQEKFWWIPKSEKNEQD